MATTMTATKQAWLVRAGDSHVVAMFWGADGDTEIEVAYWRGRGYDVEAVDPATI